MRLPALPGEDSVEPRADVRVIVEADHLGLGKRLGKLGAVPFCQAAGRHYRTAGVRRRQKLSDGVLLGGLDEAAGIHENHACFSVNTVGSNIIVDVLGVRAGVRADQRPARGFKARREFLGIDLVARAAERDQTDGPVRGAYAALTRWHIGRLR